MVTDLAITAVSEAAGKIADAVRTRDELRIKLLETGGEYALLVYNDLLREDEAKEAFHGFGGPFRWLAKQLDGDSK